MFLIKVGGGKTVRWDYIARDLADIAKTRRIVILHGANALRDEIAQKMGHPTKVITAPSGIESVHTDRHAIDIMLMAYVGLANKRIVATLQAQGINAIGLSGIDGRALEGKWKRHILAKESKKTKLVSGTLTGKVEQVNTRLLKGLMNNGYTPVLCPPAISYEDTIINFDNDTAAAVLAGALKVREIVSLFEAPGLLKDFSDQSSVVREIDKDKIDEFMDSAQGRMKKKLLGAKEAFLRGVEKVYLADGRVKQPITNAFMGSGTVMR